MRQESGKRGSIGWKRISPVSRNNLKKVPTGFSRINRRRIHFGAHSLARFPPSFANGYGGTDREAATEDISELASRTPYPDKTARKSERSELETTEHPPSHATA